jgi:hypothetical protein
MADVINEAVENTKRKAESEAESERPKKKHKKDKSKKKIDESEQQEGKEPIKLTKEEYDKHQIAKKELKSLHLKHTAIDVSEAERIDEYVESLTPEEVRQKIENIRMHIGLESPLGKAENFLGLIAIAVQKALGSSTLYQRIMSDDHIIAAVDYLLPEIRDRFSAPVTLLHRIGVHISDDVHNVNTFSSASKINNS